jgi:hypothetical protein
VSARRWFERAFIYWLVKSWWGFFERRRLTALLLLPFITLTFILAAGLLIVVDVAVALVKVKRLITRG